LRREKEEKEKMEGNRYAMAGWLAIANAVIFPLAFIIGIIQGIIGAAALGYKGPTVGPSDLLFILFTIFGVYVVYMFRNLLHERYDYHGIDTLITLSIWWMIIFQVASIALKIGTIVAWPVSDIILAAVYLTFMTAAMITGGVIDILIAIKLFQIKDSLNDLLKAYTYIIMISGALQASVILSPLALLLLPVSMVIIGMIFLKDKEEVDFV
jgi:hypothetical protein